MKVTGWTRGFPFHLVFFFGPLDWDMAWVRNPPICPGHDLDLGQHVLQAGRADGTATDGSPTFGETVTNVWRILEILPDYIFFKAKSQHALFYVYGFVVRFRLDSVLRCMFIISFQFDHKEFS